MAKTLHEKEIMDACVADIQNMIRLVRPGKEWRIKYVEITPETLAEFTEWQRERFGLDMRKEVICIWDEDDCLLYIVDVYAESVLYAMANLMKLIADKY